MPAMAPPLSADQLSLLLPAVGVLCTAVLLFRSRPRAAAALWFGLLCLVPCWVEVSFKYSFPALVIVTILMVVALFPTVPREIGIGDWLMLGFFMVSVVPMYLGLGGDKSSVMVLVTYWGAAYLLGRTLALHTGVDWLYRCAAIAFTVVAAGAVIEFAFSWNPFIGIHMSNGLYDTWATIQERGGVARAEGAFGHSIALGASVALAIPLVIASRFTFRTKTLMVVLMLACEVVTFSRAGMVCAALAVALMAVFGREGLTTRARAAAVTMLVAVAVAAMPLVTQTYADAGEEASNSADYRLSLTALIPHIALLGRSHDMYVSANGTHYVGRFRSIDSALILLGLTYGLIPVLIAATMLLAGIYLVATRLATAPTIAVVAQIPAFLSVAMITQYQLLVWFMVGLAVCTQVMRKHTDVRRLLTNENSPRGLVNISGGMRAATGGND